MFFFFNFLSTEARVNSRPMCVVSRCQISSYSFSCYRPKGNFTEVASFSFVDCFVASKPGWVYQDTLQSSKLGVFFYAVVTKICADSHRTTPSVVTVSAPLPQLRLTVSVCVEFCCREQYQVAPTRRRRKERRRGSPLMRSGGEGTGQKKVRDRPEKQYQESSQNPADNSLLCIYVALALFFFLTHD